jgi:hypothetical protein
MLEPDMKLLFLFVLITSIVLAAHQGSLLRVLGRRVAA